METSDQNPPGVHPKHSALQTQSFRTSIRYEYNLFHVFYPTVLPTALPTAFIIHQLPSYSLSSLHANWSVWISPPGRARLVWGRRPQILSIQNRREHLPNALQFCTYRSPDCSQNRREMQYQHQNQKHQSNAHIISRGRIWCLLRNQIHHRAITTVRQPNDSSLSPAYPPPSSAHRSSRPVSSSSWNEDLNVF